MEQEDSDLHPYLTLRGKPSKVNTRKCRKKKGYKPPKPTMARPFLWLFCDPLADLKKCEARNAASRGSGIGRKVGHAHGYRESSLPAMRSRAKKAARKVVKFMKDNKLFVADNDVADEAVQATIEILRGPTATADKLKAAKTLLEYTQRKPVAETEVTLNRAEAFLEAVLKEVDKPDET